MLLFVQTGIEKSDIVDILLGHYSTRYSELDILGSSISKSRGRTSVCCFAMQFAICPDNVF